MEDVIKGNGTILDESMKKAKRLIEIVVCFCPVIGLLISVLRLGDFEVSKQYCNFVKSIVPSIQGTAMVASDPSGTLLLLSIVWPLAFYTACQWLYWALLSKVKESNMREQCMRNICISFFGLSIFGFITAWFFNNALTLDGSGRALRIIKWSLLNGSFTSSLIVGMIIIVMCWAIALSLYLGIKTLQVNYFQDR